MTTFSQWSVGQQKKPGVRQITWVCGPERVLVEDVVDTIKRELAPEPWNYVPLVAGEDSDRAIWAEIDQHPVGKSPRLVVVRNAERLKTPERLVEWVKFRLLNPRTYLLFISNDEKIPRMPPTPEERRSFSKGALFPHIMALNKVGQSIECRPYTAATAKHAVVWVQSKVKMRDGVAAHLLNRANGDLRLVRDMCTKLSVFPTEVTITTINGMLEERPRDTFADALIALDKKTALLALRDIAPAEYTRTLGQLDAQLDLAGMIHDMQTEHKTQSEITRAAGNKNFLVKDLLPVAKHYDSKRRLAIRKTLALADESLRGGANVGVMEVVVAFW